MSTNFLALTLFVFTSATLFAQADPVKPEGPVDVSKSADGKIQIQARPLVRQIAPHDPLRVALHFSVVGEKIEERREPDKGVAVDFGKTWAGTKFIVTTPAAKKHELTAELTGKLHPSMSTLQSMRRFASPTLAIDRTGFVIPSQYGDVNGKWKEEAPDFGQPGKYTLELKGELVGAGTTFATGKLNFEVAMGTQAIKQAFEKAHVEVARKFPEANFKLSWTESGYVPGLVYEDGKDRRLLFFNGQFEKREWSYELVRVAITRAGEVVEIAHRSVGTCIAEGTPIDTPEGPRAIETLREGDTIWSFDLTAAKRVKTTIQSTRSLHTDSTLLISKSLRITANHPLYVNDAWIPAGQASLGDRLLTAEGKPAVIGEIRERREPVDVFDLTVDGPHNYFAGGFLVHNKDRGWSASLDDTWHFFWPAKPHEWKID